MGSLQNKKIPEPLQSSDEESELESDDEILKGKKRVKLHDNEQAKMPKLQHIIDKFVSTQPEPTIIPTSIYEKPAPKEIHISVPEKLEVAEIAEFSNTVTNDILGLSKTFSSSDSINMHPANSDKSEELVNNAGFGKIDPILKLPVNEEDNEQAEEEWDDGEFISSKKLKK